MSRKAPPLSSSANDFDLPFQGQLSSNNRWVILAELIPWEEFEEEYAQYFSADKGAPAKFFRMALGALIIKEKDFPEKASPSHQKTTSVFEKKSLPY